MIKRSWVRAPAPYTGWIYAMLALAITYKKIMKIKVVEWGTPKKIF